MTFHPAVTSPRAAIMAVFAAYGAAVGAISGSMPAMTQASGVGSLGLGLIITMATLATVAVMSMGGAIARRASSRALLLASLPAFALLVLLLLTSGSRPVFFMVYVALGFAMGLTDIVMNAEGAAIEHDMGKPIFSAFHGSVSTSLPVFAILSSYLAAIAGTWATGLCVAAVFAAAWIMVQRFVPVRPASFGRQARISSLPNKSPLILLGVAAGLIIASETAAIMWSAKLLAGQAPGLAAMTGLGAAFFGICNAAIRFPGDRLRARFGELPLMTGSLMVAIAGFAVLGVSQSFAVSVAAFAAVGLGTAVLIPCTFALAAGLVPLNRAAGIGFVSMIAGGPRSLAHWVFGWAAHEAGIGAAFGFFAGLLTVSLVLVVVLRGGRREWTLRPAPAYNTGQTGETQ